MLTETDVKGRDGMERWELQSERELFKRRIFTLKDSECRHPVSGEVHSFFTIHTPDWINVVAETEDGRFVMVRQHRLGNDEITLETPGGLVEPGEAPIETARRELREETGYEAGEIVLLKECSVNPAIFNNRIFFFLARGCRRLHAQSLDRTEDIEVITHTGDEIMGMIADGSIRHSIILTAFFLYFLSKWGGMVEDGSRLARLR